MPEQGTQHLKRIPSFNEAKRFPGVTVQRGQSPYLAQEVVRKLDILAIIRLQQVANSDWRKPVELELGTNDSHRDLEIANDKSPLAKKPISQPLEAVLIVLVASQVILAYHKIHEFEVMEKRVDRGRRREEIFECEANDSFCSTSLAVRSQGDSSQFCNGA
jgi:hypothetical protein